MESGHRAGGLSVWFLIPCSCFSSLTIRIGVLGAPYTHAPPLHRADDSRAHRSDIVVYESSIGHMVLEHSFLANVRLLYVS